MSDWRIAWTLARRELDLRFRGLRLLLVCLFLGVGTLAAIGSLTRAITTELRDQGQVLLGGDVELSVSQRQADAPERAALRDLGRVSTTLRMQSMAVAGGRTAPVELKAVDAAYPLYGRIAVTGRTAATPGPDGVWIAPALARRLGLSVGDPIRFGTAPFRVAGIIADEPDRLGEGFTLGAVAIVSLDGLARTGLVQPGSLYQTKYRIALSGGSPDTAAQAFERRFPTGGWEHRTRDRASPGADRFLTRMGEFLTLVGLAALVVAGIGVGNGVAAYLGRRRGGIATLKILGATAAVVRRTYLLQIVLVGVVGVAAGIVAGVAAVPLILWIAGDALPVRPGFAVYPLPLLLAGAYGMLIAIGFAIPPLADAGDVPAAGLLRGAADGRRAGWRRTLPPMAAAFGAVLALALLTSDRPSFTAIFLAAAAGTLVLLAVIGALVRRGARRLPRPRRPLLRLAIAALHRPGAQTTALVVALGLGLTLFVLLAAIRTSIDANIARTIPARAPALFALDVPPDREGEFRRTVAAAASPADIRTVPLMRGTITAYGDTRVADLQTIPEGAWALRGERGLTFADTLPEGSALVAGRWWPRGYRGPPLVSVDERLADALDLKVGDPLTVSVLGAERTARIASLRRIAWDTLGFNFVMVFSPDALADVPHNLAATIDLPPGTEDRVVAAITPRFPSTSVVEVRDTIAQVRDVVGQMATAIAAAASIAILAGIAVLAGAIGAAREARTYDGVILKTLGATRAQVLGALLIEYALLAALLAAVALAIGLPGAWLVVTRMFDFEWLPDAAAIAATLAGGAAITIGIGLIGALPILSARPARALREL